MEETASFGKIGKTKARYGSVNNASHTNDKFIKYYLKQGDTMQGIALKHGVTMDVIRRANQIWTNDSLYLRDFILIPLPNTLCNGASQAPAVNNLQPHQNGACALPLSSSTVSNAASEHCVEIVTRQDLVRNSKGMPRSKSCMESVSNNCDKTGESKKQSEPSAKDFLSKFDVNLEQIKRNVERLDANTNFPEDCNNPLNLLPKRRSATFGRRHPRSMDEDFSLDLTRAPDLAFVSGGTTTRASGQLRRSNERLQREQDSLYQL